MEQIDVNNEIEKLVDDIYEAQEQMKPTKCFTWHGLAEKLYNMGYRKVDVTNVNSTYGMLKEPTRFVSDGKDLDKGVGVQSKEPCKYCGSYGRVLRRKGPHVGEYCNACCRWLSWVHISLPPKIGRSAAQIVQDEFYKSKEIICDTCNRCNICNHDIKDNDKNCKNYLSNNISENNDDCPF